MLKEETKLASRINSSLNHSLSKASYSFSRAERFKEQKKDLYFVFYNISQGLNKKGTSIGYGNKIDFTAQSKKNGCPNLYGFPSSFDPKYHNAPAFTFGTSRPVQSNRARNKDLTPGPKYNLSIPIGSNAPSYSLRDKCDKVLIKKFNGPGPGAYFNQNQRELGRYMESKYKNSVGISLDLRAKRFNYKINDKDKSPGPASYELPNLMKIGGQIFESKYQSHPARSFIGHRNNSQKILLSPGPGAYNSFSEFEGYDEKRSCPQII